jgi:hypothetical protein
MIPPPEFQLEEQRNLPEFRVSITRKKKGADGSIILCDEEKDQMISTFESVVPELRIEDLYINQ